jgi:hypothetical protein
MYNHRPVPIYRSKERTTFDYDLLSGSFKIPSASNRLLASSSAHVCILFHHQPLLRKSDFPAFIIHTIINSSLNHPGIFPKE